MTRAKYVPLAIFTLLQCADAFTTRMAAHIPGIVEKNPVVAMLGLWPAKVLAIALFARFLYKSKTYGHLWLVCGIYVLIVASNLSFVLGLR